MGEGHVRSREEGGFPSLALQHRHGLWREAVLVGFYFFVCGLLCFVFVVLLLFFFLINKDFFPSKVI